jgi:hypothetical protein
MAVAFFEVLVVKENMIFSWLVFGSLG